MEENVDSPIELVTAILVIAMFAPFLFQVSTMFLRDFGGFNNTINEKTALASTGEIIVEERVIDRSDIMLMLAVADRYAMSPNTYSVNGIQVTIDDNYLTNRLPVMNAIFLSMDTTPKKFTLYYGPAGPRMWVIENK